MRRAATHARIANKLFAGAYQRDSAAQLELANFLAPRDRFAMFVLALLFAFLSGVWLRENVDRALTAAVARLRAAYVSAYGRDGRGTAPRHVYRASTGPFAADLCSAGMPWLPGVDGKQTLCENCSWWGPRGYPWAERLHAAAVHVHKSLHRAGLRR